MGRRATIDRAVPAWARRRAAWPRLGETLQGFVARFPAADRLASDPVHLAHGYARGVDAEVAALIAALLAFGRAASLIAKARAAIEPLGARPADALAELRPGTPPHLAGWVHRWVGADDLAGLLHGIGRVLRDHGSLGAAFRAGLPACDGRDDLLPAMRAFALALVGDAAAPRSRSARHLLAVPDGHAASKRLCLFLRWMVRREDGIDLGLWTDVGARRLTIPLDTHVARIGAYVGLTDRRTPGWAMAREITTNLARFDPDDPTRFDFALSHLGIMGSCPRRRDERLCAACDLLPACRL